MRKSVEVDMSALVRLRDRAPDVLRGLDRPVLDAAQRGMDQAAFSVPRRAPEAEEYDAEGNLVGGGTKEGEVPLADTAFVSGPHHNLSRRLSTTATAGYAHSQAGPIHEGFHWGKQTQNPPPNWLRRAFKRGVRTLLVKGVSTQLMKSLAKYFPK